jgi:hypothetical protein|tara:strand:- start:10345 stop:10848 length:504 start_codon:yes stop_codon:yes gene_type:complete
MEKLTIRLDSSVKEAVWNYCIKNNVTISAFLRFSVLYYLKKTKSDIDDEEVKKLVRKIKFVNEKKGITRYNDDLYLIKRAFTHIINHSKMALITTGKLNMKVVSKLIDEYEKAYDLMDDGIKEDMKEQWRNIQHLKNESYLMRFLREWDIVKDFLPKQLEQITKKKR